MSITFDQIKTVHSGARFYTADLHVHSFGGSADVKDVSMTVEQIIDSAFAHKVSLLTVTDHNSTLNLQAAQDYAIKYAGQLLVLPGMEVTTAHGHLLAYFDPKNPDRVRDLLALIKLQGKQGARDSHTAMAMAEVIAEVERLGGICVAAHIDRTQTGFEMLAPGFPNWKKDIISSPGLYGLEFDNADNLQWYSSDDEGTAQAGERKKIYNTRLAAGTTAPRAVLAAVQNSDAHTMKDFVAQHAKRSLTRFKMNELSFEGFRTALVDPTARVRATATIPKAVPRILGMQVSGGFLDGTTVQFSDNLTCFIGGRGTGKSTAIQSLAYGLGGNEALSDCDNCPDSIVVYCEDENGTRYRYERIRGREVTVQAKEDSTITDVPADSFRVEFYAQGELAEVAKNPLVNPLLLQEFLDRHISLSDLQRREQDLIQLLSDNSVQLIPYETSNAQLPAKKTDFDELNKKLEVAEAGRLKEVAAGQARLAAEKGLVDSLGAIEKLYSSGLSLASAKRSYDTVVADAGALTGDARSLPYLAKAKSIIDQANAIVDAEQQQLNLRLQQFAADLRLALQSLRQEHKVMEQEIGAKIMDFQKKGLSGDLKGLNDLIKLRSTITAVITRITGQQSELNRLREERTGLLVQLRGVRGAMADLRKEQVKVINRVLPRTIEDYAINLYYDSAGIPDEFVQFVTRKMQGTYFKEDTARQLCSSVRPEELADLLRNRDTKAIGQVPGCANWGEEIPRRFGDLTSIHALEVLPKQPKPIIKVLTKGTAPKQIPVNQLSDGQKHTILLTIALLAESNLPLIMDQPEDDLDNAFIFKSVVSVLRTIKERRQILMVTHNANIAVLGDSELLCPMQRSGDTGRVFDRGSVDRPETAKAVQDILEGGELAFRRRREIYGH
jgi:hypothetical protein